MGWSILNSTSAQNGTNSSVTTSAIDTRGANLIIAGFSGLNDSSLAISDSQSNTWSSAINFQTNNPAVNVAVFYVQNPSTNASHTFTISDPNGYSGVSVLAVSGALSFGTVLDQTNFTIYNTTNNGSMQTGSITPTANGELLIVFNNIYNDSTPPTLGIDSGFTQQTTVACSSTNFGMTAFTLVQSVAAPINPTVTRSPGQPANQGGDWSAIVSFFPSVPIWGFEPQPVQPKLPNKASGLFGFQGGIEARFVNWKNSGWEVQSWQPLYKFHRMDSRDIQTVLPPPPRLVPLNWGQELQSGWQPPHGKPEQKAAAIAPKDDGVYAPFILWKNTGWEVQPWQPPLWPKKNQLWGALSHPEEGIEGVFIPPLIPPIPPPIIIPPPPPIVVNKDMAVLGYTSVFSFVFETNITNQTLYWDFGTTESFWMLDNQTGFFRKVTPLFAYNWFLSNMGSGLTEIYNPFRSNWLNRPSNLL